MYFLYELDNKEFSQKVNQKWLTDYGLNYSVFCKNISYQIQMTSTFNFFQKSFMNINIKNLKFKQISMQDSNKENYRINQENLLKATKYNKILFKLQTLRQQLEDHVEHNINKVQILENTYLRELLKKINVDFTERRLKQQNLHNDINSFKEKINQLINSHIQTLRQKEDQYVNDMREQLTLLEAELKKQKNKMNAKYEQIIRKSNQRINMATQKMNLLRIKIQDSINLLKNYSKSKIKSMDQKLVIQKEDYEKHSKNLISVLEKLYQKYHKDISLLKDKRERRRQELLNLIEEVVLRLIQTVSQ